jgi:cysteine synthase
MRERLASHLLSSNKKFNRRTATAVFGLAMICAAKGYKCIIAMPQLPPFEERYIICRMFGSDVHLTAPAKGMPGLKEYTEDFVAKNEGYFLVNQFYNEANPNIHYTTTGPEIWEQSGEMYKLELFDFVWIEVFPNVNFHHSSHYSGENVDYFVTGVGTGGTALVQVNTSPRRILTAR